MGWLHTGALSGRLKACESTPRPIGRGVGFGPAALSDREGLARRRRRQGRLSGGALQLDCAARRARLGSDQGLGGLSGQVTDHASVDDV